MTIRRLRMVLLALPACACMLAAGGARAQARGPSAQELLGRAPRTEEAIHVADRATKLSEMDVWMRRLVGRFRYDGLVEDPADYCYEKFVRGRSVRICVAGRPATGKGLGDCIGVGTGSGLHCVLNVTWQEQFSLLPPNPQIFNTQFPPFAPTMILYGIDPVTLGIRYLQSDRRGIVEASHGVLKEDTAVFKTACVNRVAAERCTRSIRIHAPAHGRFLRLWVDIEATPGTDGSKRVAGYTFDLRRVPQGPEDRSSKVPVPPAKRKR